MLGLVVEVVGIIVPAVASGPGGAEVSLKVRKPFLKFQGVETHRKWQETERPGFVFEI